MTEQRRDGQHLDEIRVTVYTAETGLTECSKSCITIGFSTGTILN
jgi:hypothetical protein